MPTIRISNEVKEKLENLMLSELKKEIKEPKTLVKALVRNKFGFTHSKFIERLIKSYKR